MYYLSLFIFIGRNIRLVTINLDASETNSIGLQYILCTCSAIMKCDHEDVMTVGMIIALQVCGDIK
jgi:hypothetical protein